MNALRVLLIIFLAFLSLGTVVKRKGAIELTRTDPVAYEEKKKEEAEGKKGPPAPSLNLFPREKFLVDPPVEKDKKEGGQIKLEAEEEELVDWDSWYEEDEEQTGTAAPEEELKLLDFEDDTSDTVQKENFSGEETLEESDWLE
jgi:hypothetical protein